MRKFSSTHPWLRFTADLRSAPPKLWMMLGECQSKSEHIAGVPLQPETAARLYRMYLAKGAAATTAIEGNTLSEDEVLQHLEGKLRLPPSREYLAQEVDNIVAACNSIVEGVERGTSLPLTLEGFKELNGLVLRRLVLEEGVIPGEIRRHEVGVARYRAAPPEDCEYLLTRLYQWLRSGDFEPAPGMGLAYAILKSVLCHLYFAWIHPFGDGNGRTARLVEFQILISSGVPAPAAHLLSNHYNQTRNEYYRQLDQASRSGGDVIPFVMYAVEGFLEGLRSQLSVIREQQWNVTWENYVHDFFGDTSSPAHDRQRFLVLDLSTHPHPVPIAKLAEVSPRVAAAYARKTNKTLMRDIKALLEADLLKIDGMGVRPNKELILAFLPTRAQAGNRGGSQSPEVKRRSARKGSRRGRL